MAVATQVLFDTPQCEIASILRDRLGRCASASLVSGFATVEGIEAIAQPIRTSPSKLRCLVIGAGTYRAYEAFDRLIGAGVPQDRFHIHLGHTRTTGEGARHPFYRYHPMLHSKVYLLDMADGSACAFVGSHNLTGFALLGLNGEAGVLLEGRADAPEIDSIRQHIDESLAQSVQYAPGMKEAYSWWAVQFVEGFRDKVDDGPREGEAQRTIVILAVRADDPLPGPNDVIYFEIPVAIGQIQSLRAEVHIYIFGKRPATPRDGLIRLDEARKSLWCRTVGLENEQGGRELRADWYIESAMRPELRPAPRPFRPTPLPNMQQVRVRVRNQVFDRFEYLFHTARATWEPVFDEEPKIGMPEHGTSFRSVINVSPQEQNLLTSLALVPPEDREWFLVRALRSVEPSINQVYTRPVA